MSLQISLWRWFSLLYSIKNFWVKNYFLIVDYSCPVHTAKKRPQCSKKNWSLGGDPVQAVKLFQLSNLPNPVHHSRTLTMLFFFCRCKSKTNLWIFLSWYNFNLNGSGSSDDTLQLIYLSLYFHSSDLFVIGQFHK